MITNDTTVIITTYPRKGTETLSFSLVCCYSRITTYPRKGTETVSNSQHV